MKKHIETKQLFELSTYQKDRLNELWIPQKYDLAVAHVCKDALNDKYDYIEFVVGEVEVEETLRNNFHNAYLWNLETMNKNIENGEDLGDDNEKGYEFEYYIPASYNKKECLPLLNIGQMIEMLEKLDYGYGDFYIDIKSKNYGVGRKIYNYSDYGNEYDGKELCDVLWELIKDNLI